MVKTRNYSFDLMKFFCVVAVICIHLEPFINSYLGSIINALCRVAVPLFFMCSGYLFLSKFSKDYSKKYFYKMLNYFITWNVLYTLMFIFINFFSEGGINKSINYIFNNYKIVNIYYGVGMIQFHLWYLTAMVLIIPALYIVNKYNLINKTLIISGLLNISSIFIYNSGYLNNNRDAIFFALFYCTLGMYLKSKEEIIRKKLKNKINNIYLIYILLFTITSLIERLLYDLVFIRTGDFYVSTIPLSILIFLLCVVKVKKVDNIFCKIGRQSFGIYVIHVAIIKIIYMFLYKFDMHEFTLTTIWQIIGTPIVMFLSLISYEVLILISNKFLALIRNKKINREYIID